MMKKKTVNFATRGRRPLLRRSKSFQIPSYIRILPIVMANSLSFAFFNFDRDGGGGNQY